MHLLGLYLLLLLEYQAHRITCYFKLEGPFRDHLVLAFCYMQGHLSLDQFSQSHTANFNKTSGRACTTSLDKLFQCVAICIVKSYFLISNLKLPAFTLKSLPCPVTTDISLYYEVSLYLFHTPMYFLFFFLSLKSQNVL